MKRFLVKQIFPRVVRRKWQKKNVKNKEKRAITAERTDMCAPVDHCRFNVDSNGATLLPERERARNANECDAMVQRNACVTLNHYIYLLIYRACINFNENRRCKLIY